MQPGAPPIASHIGGETPRPRKRPSGVGSRYASPRSIQASARRPRSPRWRRHHRVGQGAILKEQVLKLDQIPPDTSSLFPMAPYKSLHPPITVCEESFATFLLKDDPYPPDIPAYIDGISGQTVTRRAHRQQVMELAAGLRNVEKAGLLPLKKGSTVVVYSVNSTLFPAVIMAMVRNCRITCI